MKLKNLFVAILALSLLTSPALAQKGRRSNMGSGAMTGRARANQVQAENNSPSKGTKAKKTRTREGWEKNAQHRAKAKGHSK